MNASIRGPFVPVWSDACWSDGYLDSVNEQTKLVGMTYNCKKDIDIPPHVSSMIWATDRIGLEILLQAGLKTCFKDKVEAIDLEIFASTRIQDAGYQVDALMTAFHTDLGYQADCHHDDVNWEGGYFGMNLHPYDTMFLKANRGVAENVLTMFTDWFNKMEYDSHEFCGTRKKIGSEVGTVGERLAKERVQGDTASS
ncbi:hypothetical protein TWF694_010979 [Orbilia ellipsospora]|uniref:Uncharacterized protein n=1 Tax=Orbilia ellipsospora TaxID=2528407 RepID=A0AAV9X8S7_9PEZI